MGLTAFSPEMGIRAMERAQTNEMKTALENALSDERKKSEALEKENVELKEQVRVLEEKLRVSRSELLKALEAKNLPAAKDGA